MATAKLILDKRRKDSSLIDEINNIDNNKYPLRIRIYKGVENKEITIKYKFSVNEWIEAENRVAKSFPNSVRVNSAIQRRFSIATTVLSDYDNVIKDMDINSIKNLVQAEIDKQINPVRPDPEILKIISESISKESGTYLGKYGSILITRTRKKEKHGTAKWYEDAISAIKKFNNGKDLPLKDITISFLENFEAEHIAKGNSKNGISSYLRSIRAITNYAIKEVFHGKRYEGYPWGSGGYSIPHEKTKKRAVKKDIIDELRKLELKKNSALWDAQNYFLFMFNNRGMNFIDIAKLKRKQITQSVFEDGKLISGRNEYTRSKNQKDFSIKLTTESLKILNSYKIDKMAPEDFIFPIGFENSKAGLECYCQKRKRNNERFRELAKLIGEKELNLTTYVARHSWATIAKNSGISHAIIGDGLGHSDSKTTETYLEEFENDVLDNANEMIVSH
jgi:integrase/recombinase XerD